jgi:NADPH-dependent curcumin reductase CurA
MPSVNRQVLLVSRPTKSAGLDNFRLFETPLVPLQQGQIRVRNHYLSLDPYMRLRMNDCPSYAAPQPLGQVMLGATVGVVEESRAAGFVAGDKVLATFGWQEYGVGTAGDLRKVDDSCVPLSAYLGCVGMPGVAAWMGVHRILQVKANETLIVSAASGAVGSVAGQLAKHLGLCVVGITGGPQKCAYVTGELGFDACVDYKGGSMPNDLEAATPAGVEAYFDNVGGEVLDAVMARMKVFGRIAVCGRVAEYDGANIPLKNPGLILDRRLKIEGFGVMEQKGWRDALEELCRLVSSGKLKFRESIVHGLEKAPEAFLGLLKGRNFGKQLVKLT